MKKALITLTCMAAVAVMQAEVLTPDQALERISTSESATVRAKAASKSNLQLVYTSTYENAPTAYVFSNSGKGFMVLSADDVAAPVLAYSDNGSFDPDNIPPAAAYWLEMYSREIAAASGTRYSAASHSTDYDPIGPLCTTMWDQSSPYNNLCPRSGSIRCYTGCVATAMAQVMKYHNYPAVGTGTVYNSNTSSSLDLSTYTFDWTNMIDDYSGKYTDDEATAVAQLMYACGMAVNMGYSTTASGAVSQKVSTALVNNFYYDKGCYYAYRDNYTYTQWFDMLYNSLKDDGPVVYSGYTDNLEGHCWVCDGYSSDGYFHFNWGWSGVSDGYYLLTCLNPLEQGVGGSSNIGNFDYYQDAILGITEPKDGTDYVYQIFATTDMELTWSGNASYVSLGRSIKINGEYFNGTVITLTSGSLGLRIIAEDGSYDAYVKGEAFVNFQPCYYSTGYTINLPTKLSEGDYKLVPAWADKSGVIRDMLMLVHGVASYAMTVSGSACYFTPNYSDEYVDITDIALDVPVAYADKTIKLTATATNNAGIEFLSNICAGIYKSGSSRSSGTAPDYVGSSMLLSLNDGASTEIEYSSAMEGSVAGDYVMYFMNPTSYQWYSDAFAITLVEAPETSTVEVSNFILNGGLAEIIDLDDIPFEFDVECVDGLLDGTLTVAIFRANQTSWYTSEQTESLMLYPGESQHVKASLSLTNVNRYNIEFHAYVYDGTTSSSNVLAGPLDFTYVEEYSGITDISTDTEALSTEYFNLQGHKVETPANGVYIRLSHYADGSTAATKVTIK